MTWLLNHDESAIGLYKDSGIYKIQNMITNGFYIGSAVDLGKRFITHRNELENNRHFNNHLQRSYNKYGSNNFRFDPIFFCDKEDLVYFETILINKLKPTYNQRHIPESNLGLKWTEETKQIQRAQRLGKKRSDDDRKKISLGQIGSVRAAKTYAGLISPSGEVFKNIFNMAKFGREHGFERKHIWAVLVGKVRHHKGWTLYKEVQ